MPFRFLPYLAALAVCSLATAPASAQLQPIPAEGEAATPGERATAPPPDEQPSDRPVISGLFDMYYLYQFHNPPARSLLTPGRTYYDVRVKQPTLALAEIDVDQQPRPGRMGYKLTLIAGDIADLNHAGGANALNNNIVQSDGREANFKHIQQAYLSFGAGASTIDLGKFYTPIGYEVTEATGNFNYSRSMLFNILPVYHAGLRVAYPVSEDFTVTGYLVNALYNTGTAGLTDDNRDKSLIGQVAYARGPLTLYNTLGWGREKLNGVDTQPSTFYDFWGTYELEGGHTVALNFDYRNDRRTSAADGIRFSGVAGYWNYRFQPNQAFTARFSTLQAKGDPVGGGGTTNRLSEITGTYEYNVSDSFTTRFELRRDWANFDTFVDGGGVPTKRNQTTALVAGLYAF